MKWLSKLFKGGSNRGGASDGGGSGSGRRRPQFICDENMVLCAPVRALVSIAFLFLYLAFS